MTRAWPLALLALVAGCGGERTVTQAPAPASPEQPATGTLRIFSYDDTVAKPMINPFKKANPGVTLKIATFDSNQEAAAKLRAGFKADIVNVCLDEMQPLIKANLLRPIDTTGVKAWNDLTPTLRNAKGVTIDGKVYVVPNSAGPQGLIYNTKALPQGIDSFKDLFDPSLKGRVTMDGGNALTPIAETALAMGMKDPMSLTDDQVGQVKDYMLAHRDQFRTFSSSDPDMVNLFKSGEVVASDGGRGTVQELLDAHVPVKYVKPVEGQLSWVCGFGITRDATNLNAAYRLINWYTSPKGQATLAHGGFVISNPKAIPLVPAKFKSTADPSSIDGAIAEAEPDNFSVWTRAWQEIKAAGG
jgi:spermidine/putrescine-binding protein